MVSTILLCSCNAFALIDVQMSDPMRTSFLKEVVNAIDRGENVIFAKFGDGEYECITRNGGNNCDGDTYHAWLAQALKEAFISLAKKPNTFLAKWLWDQRVPDFFNGLAKDNGITVPWAHYHLIMNDDAFFDYNYMYKFAECIINSKKKKILLCNSMNKRLKDFFRVDAYIELPAQNWSFDYEFWKQQLQQQVEEGAIILVAGGLCSKVLIDDITNEYKVTFIDLGSSFDYLAGKRNSRNRRHSYEDEVRYYKKLLPSNWDKN